MKYTPESYVTAIDNCKGKDEAIVLAEAIFAGEKPLSNPYKSGVPSSWLVFYKLKKMEDKFDIGYHASSFVAMDLISPKISNVWLKKKSGDESTVVEKSDFLSQLWIDLSTKYIPEWDESINDNFLAYLVPNLSTTVNELLKPEIPKYIQEVKGLSLTSLDKLMEKDESGSFEPEDTKNAPIEERILSTDEHVKSGILKVNASKYLVQDIARKEGEDDDSYNKRLLKAKETAKRLYRAALIQRTVFAGKLGGGYRNFSDEMFDAINYFENKSEEAQKKAAQKKDAPAPETTEKEAEPAHEEKEEEK